MALPKQNRLKKKKDFEEIFKKGKTLHGDFLLVKYKKAINKSSRFAIVVSSKVAKTAVLRNRIRRALSEAVQPHLLGRELNDVVVLIKKTPSDPKVLKNDLLTTLRKAHIV